MEISAAEGLEQIDSLSLLDELFKRFFRKRTITNNYILAQEYAHYIEAGKLWHSSNGDNAYFFLEKNGFFRLYYFLNEQNDGYSAAVSVPVVLEIIFRGNKRYPEQEVAFWQNATFKKHLRRDCYFLKSSVAGDLIEQDRSTSDITIKKATSIEEYQYTKRLIDTSLDTYTGDVLSVNEIAQFASNGNIYIAYRNDSPCGILHSKLKNKVFWLDHIVVDQSYRGMGVSKVLINYYLQEGLMQECSKFQLWVISDNLPAVNLYKKYRFQYLNKSTISMLKLPYGQDT